MTLQAIQTGLSIGGGYTASALSLASYGVAITLPITYFLDVMSYQTNYDNPYDNLNLCNTAVPTSPVITRTILNFVGTKGQMDSDNCDWKATTERFQEWLFGPLENTFFKLVPNIVTSLSVTSLGAGYLLKLLSNTLLARPKIEKLN